LNGKLQPFRKIENIGPPQVVGVTITKGETVGCYPENRERFENGEYIVFRDKYPPGPMGVMIWELSILRVDGGHHHDWRDMQAIKTMLVGSEYEGVELYPAESRVVDVANEYHIHCIMTPDEKPITFHCGRTGRREVNDLLAFGQRRL